MAAQSNQKPYLGETGLQHLITKTEETFVSNDKLNEEVGKLGYSTDTELEKKYVQKDGEKVLSTNDYDNSEKEKVAGAVQSANLESEVTAKGFIKGDAVDTKIQEATNKIGTVKGAATKSQQETLATTANLQDIWFMTDDENHMYMFVGKGAAGANEYGFADLGNHIDLSNYVQNGTLTTTLESYMKNDVLYEITTSDIDGMFGKSA